MSETDRLISCPDCGASMSRRAPACVKCGAPNERLENERQEIEAKEKEEKEEDRWAGYWGGIIMLSASPFLYFFCIWLGMPFILSIGLAAICAIVGVHGFLKYSK